MAGHNFVPSWTNLSCSNLKNHQNSRLVIQETYFTFAEVKHIHKILLTKHVFVLIMNIL